MKRTAIAPSTKPLKRKTPMRCRIEPDVAKPSVPPKQRKCANCGDRYTPRSSWQTICEKSECIIAAIQNKRLLDKTKTLAAKEERRKDRITRESLKTINDWIADAQREFNAYIRARDEAAGHPCICCGRFGGTWSRGGIWDCGHFRSRGSAGHLRFDERNAHRQLKQCNSYGAGRHADYRVGLIARIGLEAVEALEADNKPHKWTVEELKAIKETYRQKLKELKAERNSACA